MMIGSIFFAFVNSIHAGNNNVIVEFFYSEGCPDCDEKIIIINNRHKGDETCVE